jgi:hypothetical protein
MIATTSEASKVAATVDYPRLGIYGLSVIEPGSHHSATFAPVWYNAWEALKYQQGCKSRSKNHWSLTRFGDGVPSSATVREISYALEISSRTTLKQGRECLESGKSLRKERLALLYFDAWGQTSYLEPVSSWKDSFSTDVIPWKLLKDLQVGAFSCKIRAGRGAFLDGLKIASNLLAADAADAVLIGGLFRFHPVLGFSCATATAKSEKKWIMRSGAYTAPVIERAGFALVGRSHPKNESIFHASLSSSLQLPLGFKKSVAELHQHLEKISPTASVIIGGISPSMALAEMEMEAARKLKQDPAYINMSNIYGDSGSINVLLALSHYRENRQYHAADSAVLCLESAHGYVQTIILE